MKNIFRFAILGFAFAALSGLGISRLNAPISVEEPAKTALMALAEGDSEENLPDESLPEEPEEVEEEEIFECKVILNVLPHGKVKADKTKGHVGDVVSVTANPDLFYLVEFAEVNGSRLIEDSETRGLYKFSLVEGDNRITIKFAVDQELLGKLSNIYEEASNKDWTNLFTLENLFVLIKWVLDGGVLFAIARYFVKDKRLEDKIEKKIVEIGNEVLPEATKNAVLKNTKTLVEPMFKQSVQDAALARQLMAIMVKCMVLMQQDTPEAKIAILEEFEKLNGIVDLDSIAAIKQYIDDQVSAHNKAYEDTLARLAAIGEHHQENLEEEKPEEPESEPEPENGTQI